MISVRLTFPMPVVSGTQRLVLLTPPNDAKEIAHWPGITALTVIAFGIL